MQEQRDDSAEHYSAGYESRCRQRADKEHGDCRQFCRCAEYIAMLSQQVAVRVDGYGDGNEARRQDPSAILRRKQADQSTDSADQRKRSQADRFVGDPFPLHPDQQSETDGDGKPEDSGIDEFHCRQINAIRGARDFRRILSVGRLLRAYSAPQLPGRARFFIYPNGGTFHSRPP